MFTSEVKKGMVKYLWKGHFYMKRALLHVPSNKEAIFVMVHFCTENILMHVFPCYFSNPSLSFSHHSHPVLFSLLSPLLPPFSHFSSLSPIPLLSPTHFSSEKKFSDLSGTYIYEIQKFVDTIHKNGKQTASSSKLLSMIFYISLIDSPQYQNNLTEILFELSVWINQGLYVQPSPDFFKKCLGLLLKTMKI